MSSINSSFVRPAYLSIEKYLSEIFVPIKNPVAIAEIQIMQVVTICSIFFVLKNARGEVVNWSKCTERTRAYQFQQAYPFSKQKKAEVEAGQLARVESEAVFIF